MNPKDLQLPEIDPSVYSARKLYLKEWVIDPAPWILRRFPDELITEIFKVQMEGIAEIAEIESKRIAVEAKIYKSVANLIK